MAIVDNRTVHQNYPIPDPTNKMKDDEPRLEQALQAIDADVFALFDSLSGKANASHTHPMDQITGLQVALDGKSGTGHTHTLDALSDVTSAAATNGQYLKFFGNQWVPAKIQIVDVQDLATAIEAGAVKVSRSGDTMTGRLVLPEMVLAPPSPRVWFSDNDMPAASQKLFAIGKDANIVKLETWNPTGGGYDPLSLAQTIATLDTTTGRLKFLVAPFNAANKEYYHSENFSPYANIAFNGDMSVSQERGGATGSAPPGTTKFIVDGLSLGNASDGTLSVFQGIDALDTEAPYCAFCEVTSTDVAIGAGQYVYIGKSIEGVDAAILNLGTAGAKPFVIQFKLKTNWSGTAYVSVRNSSGTRTRLYPITVVANLSTWTTYTISVPSETIGTWLKDTGVGIRITLCLACGTTYHGGFGSIYSGNYLAKADQTNVMAISGAKTQITHFDVFPGLAARDFQPDPFAVNLARCQREYEVTRFLLNGYGQQLSCVPKRAVPSVTHFPDAFSGGVLAPLGVSSLYQSVAHSAPAGTTVFLDARLL